MLLLLISIISLRSVFASLLGGEPSSVVNKQYFEVVCVPPANDLRKLILNLFHFKTKKTGINPILCFNGGAKGDRTPDLQIANLSLSLLSYSPKTKSNMQQNIPECNLYFSFSAKNRYKIIILSLLFLLRDNLLPVLPKTYSIKPKR